eukprot:TRINITY_DN23704_c0_g1_i1.p1 TRINITY_DN23704_c0_g1~~TRINITY_DN23704_c0_g1_i1.p1  ORF type:complete len:751 (+),score=127.34 TRINITY_DN23704_c0_g1_i1:79-2331(+)
MAAAGAAAAAPAAGPDGIGEAAAAQASSWGLKEAELAALHELGEALRLAAGDDAAGSPRAAPWQRRLRVLALRAAQGRVAGSSGAAARVRRTEQWRHASLGAPQRAGSPERPQPCSVLDKPTAAGRRVVYVSLARLCREQEVTAQLASFFAALEHAGQRLAEDSPLDGVLLVINAAEVRRPPAALLQHATILIAAHYPGLLSNVVVYPIAPREEAAIRQALPTIDIGQVCSWCASGPLSVPLLCTNSRSTLSRALGVGEGALAWEDVPAELREAPPTEPAEGPRRRPAGPVLVPTPWEPEGVNPATVSLDDELADCAQLLLLAPRERVARLGLRSVVQVAVTAVVGQGGATVKRVETHQITIHSDPVELVADGLQPEMLPAVSGELVARGFDARVPDGGLLRTVAQDGVAVELRTPHSADSGGDSPRRAGRDRAQRSAVLRALLLEYAPGAATAYTVLRHVVVEAGCGCPINGGLSRDALLVMLLHACRRAALRARSRGRRRGGRQAAAPPALLGEEEEGSGGRPLSAALVFHDFLVYYRDLDLRSVAINARGTDPLPRDPQHAAAQLCVLDPLDRGANLSAGCTRLPALQALFRYCAHQLGVAKGKARSNRPTSNRTPLSAIVAIEPLWLRRRQLVAGAALRTQPAPPADDAAAAVLQGVWADERGALWRVHGVAVTSGGARYQLAKGSEAPGLSLVGVDVISATPDEVAWGDGDVWHRAQSDSQHHAGAAPRHDDPAAAGDGAKHRAS